MRSEDEIRDLIAKLETTKSDVSYMDDKCSGAMLITDAIEMSIKNLEWVLEEECQK